MSAANGRSAPLAGSPTERPVTAGVDIGGTFTDCVIHAPDGRVGFGKALSTAADGYRGGFFNSLVAAGAQLGWDTLGGIVPSGIERIAHGSTVATNIVVEQRGARVGLITTAGFEDTLLMMRGEGRMVGTPPEYTFDFVAARKPEPLVPRSRICGAVERIDSLGDVVVALDERELARQVEQLLAAGCEAFAVALLWSVANPAHELRAGELIAHMAPGAFVTLSHEISRAVGEYERTLAAVINAYVGPETSSYLRAIDRELERGGMHDGLMLMQAHGGMAPVERGVAFPIWTIGSGPVGGLVATQRLAARLGLPDLIGADMGGTSFDVGIIKDGEPLMAAVSEVGRYRFRIPSVEVVSIDAGGGSIAWIDPHAMSLRVGPMSAGSSPGPACYGLGGTRPTVSDANLVLGYLDPAARFGTSREGSIQPDRELAVTAIATVAEPLGLSVLDAALGIVEIANSRMANLLENMVVGRGLDPRDFTLVAYGGSGPLHAAALAEALGAAAVIVPGEVSSVWSAYGIAAADLRFQADAEVALLEPFAVGELAVVVRELETSSTAREALANATQPVDERVVLRLRYQWQRNSLEVALAGPLGAWVSNS